jgi:hypothetical protein
MTYAHGGEIKELTIKLLAIIGAVGTLLLLVWVTTKTFERIPNAFAGLANLSANIRAYRPHATLSLSTDTDVVRSGELFTLSWKVLPNKGAYAVSYACEEGLALSILDSEEKRNVPLTCDTRFMIPKDTSEITFVTNSAHQRFADAHLTLTFIYDDLDKEITAEKTVRVVEAKVDEQMTQNTPTTEETHVPPTQPAPTLPSPAVTLPVVPIITTTVVPTSNPHGVSDLQVRTVGVGQLRNGIFTYTAAYNEDARNAIKIDVKNIGTKTSDTWKLTVILPSGYTYTSTEYTGLKPQEHMEFTLGFAIDDTKDTVKIRSTVTTTGDRQTQNNTDTWNVRVDD